MARLRVTRRVGPLGVALTVYDIWRRLPPPQRRWVMKQARRHGPRVARQVVLQAWLQQQRLRSRRRP